MKTNLRILYVTDGSEGAVNVARFLSKLPHRREVHVNIVVVAALDAERDTHEGQHIFEAAKAALGNFPGHITTGITLAGSKQRIIEMVLHTANYIDADLIALGASSHSQVARFFLGSITESIVHYAMQSVLIVRDPIMRLREILIGADDSPEARDAACFVTSKFPLPLDSTLRLVRVVSQPDLSEAVVAEGITRIQTEVEVLAGGVGKDISHTIQTHVIPGEPEEVLLQMAERNRANLIVVGSHGRTGVERFLYGSVSERIVHNAPCSVLVVKHRPIKV